MNPLPTLRLQLFGSPTITLEDGAPVAGPATHRHRLALLALLALASRHTVSREKLMAQLWPERDTEHARRLLNQAVYQLRKTCGDDVLESRGDDLALNLDLVQADVWDFLAATEQGLHREAALLYQAPFLDGFFLSEAPEFERWADQERDRLAAAYARSLEALANAAEEAGDLAGAVEWWKARAAHDPYDTRVAVRLMRAYEATGNRAGALQHAALHGRLLEEEFGAEPDPEILALAMRLRSGRTERVIPEPTLPISPPRPPPASEAESAGRTVPDPEPRRTAVRWSAAGIAATALLGVTWLATDEPAPSDTEPHPASIAVLPLVSLGPDATDAALARGMTEGLIATLGKTGGIRVVASPFTAGFPDGLDPRSVADSLGVGHLLQGSLQRTGSRLRVGVRLVAGEDGTTRWSETYDREIQDLFSVQDDLARAVSHELGVRLGGTSRLRLAHQPTANVAAYELYLLGSDPTLLRSDSAAREGLEYFRRALELDSAFAGAWAGLAQMRSRVAHDAPMPDRVRLHDLAEEAARTAMALDDSLAEAHATFGILRMNAFDFETAERHLDRSLALDPIRPLTYEWLVTLHLWTGRPAQALADAGRALALAPLSPTAHAELARALLGNDRCDEALERITRVSELRPPLLRAGPIAAECYARSGMWPEAVAALRPGAEGGVLSTLGQLGFMLARAGQVEEALQVRASLLDRWRAGRGEAYPVALVEAGLGDLDSAFAWLDRAFEDRSLVGGPGDHAHLMIMGPLMEELRRDPRFEALRPRLGLGAS